MCRNQTGSRGGGRKLLKPGGARLVQAGRWEKWPDIRSILKVEETGFPPCIGGGFEREELELTVRFLAC